MSINASFSPSPPYTASVYFNYSVLLDKAQKGNLQDAPYLTETMNVLAGNGIASGVFDQKTVDFFKEWNAIAAVVSDRPLNGYACLFRPKEGKSLYMAQGGTFLESKANLRFAVEDTIEGMKTAKNAGRRVIGFYGDSSDPNVLRKELRSEMKDMTHMVVSQLYQIPEMLHHYIEYNYPALSEERYKNVKRPG